MSFASRLVARVPWSRIVGVERRTVDLADPPSIMKYDKTSILHLRTFIRDCEKEYSFTPNWSILEQSEYIPMFIYCNMMHGGSQHAMLDGLYKAKSDDGVSVNPYVYTKEKYNVWQTQQGRDSVPFALTSGSAPTHPFIGTLQNIPRPSRVKGRLFFVRSDMIKDLDKLKGNGVVFRRKKVEIILPYSMCAIDPYTGSDIPTRNPGPRLEYRTWAWMYVARHKHWDGLLDGGFFTKPCKLYTHSNRRNHSTTYSTIKLDEPYYFFNAKEFADQ
jgi:hypothetical protein